MSTLAEQVVEQLKTDMDNVYDAGYQKGLKEIGGVDVSLFGIQNEVTGTGLVTCDYVNENEHNVEVKLSSDTVTDFSGKTVKVIKNQLLPEQDMVYKVYDYNPTVDVVLPAGGYTLYSVDGTSLICVITNVTDNIIMNTSSNKMFNFTLDSQKVVNFRWGRSNGTALYISDVVGNWMLNMGFIQLPYEPYTEKTYTANADGTLSIPSIAPTMNIVCDGVNISAKYYCTQDVEWHRFWDIFQAYGSLTTYTMIFNGVGWVDKNFKPKYPITPIQADYMFWNSRITDNPYVREIDFSQVQNMNYCFQNSTIEHVGVIDTRKCGGVTGVFHSATKLHTIDKMIFSETSSLNTNIFQSASALVNILVEGTIGQSINFSWCPLLSDASVQSIIDCLADLTGQSSQTLTFNGSVKAKLTEEQIATITSKNWTLA